MGKSKQPWQYELVVHTFNMGDVEDPDLWAANSLLEFENSEKGRWIIKNSNPVASWHRISCDYGWQYQIRAYLTEKQLVIYRLKFD